MQTITRKKLLYKTDVEYGNYAINHVLGCSHGCLYPCYAYMMARRFGRVQNCEEWHEPQIVSNALALLEDEIPKLKDKITSVHLCFTTDPFMYGYPEISDLSLQILQMLDAQRIPCTALTKGVLPKELADLAPIHEWGISLISLNEDFRQQMEPHSATYADRIASLRYLQEQNCKTWVSIEPYPTPNIVEQDLADILASIDFVGRIVFGRWHYSKLINLYPDYQAFYNQASAQVRVYCQDRDIRYLIKRKTELYSE